MIRHPAGQLLQLRKKVLTYGGWWPMEWEMDPQALLDALPDAVIVVDAQARLVAGNRTAEQVFGRSIESFRGRTVDFLLHPDDIVTAMASLASVQRKELGSSVEVRLLDAHGAYRSFEIRGRDMTADPDLGGVVLVLRDTSDRGRWEVAGGDDALYRKVLDHAPGITMLLDGNGRLRGASRALSTLVGRDLESTLGRHLRELVTQADALTVEAELALAMSEPGQRSFEVSFTFKDQDGTVPMSVTVVNLLDDRAIEGLVVSAVDITDLAESRARLQHLANHDQLTGLPNRGALTERLTAALASARRRESSVSLLYCDLDGFKAVNDRFGHQAGDHVLAEIADRLLGVTRAGDMVARMGGDEFVILVENSDERAVRALLDRIQRVMADPVPLRSEERATVGITVGTATADGCTDVDGLLNRADAAMYAAKGVRKVR